MFTEGWWLLKQTWRRSLLLTLALFCLFLVAFGLVGVMLTNTGSAWPASWPGVTFLVAFLLALFPAVTYASVAVMSAPYFGETIGTWRRLYDGLGYWGRLVKLSLCGIIFWLPLYVAQVLIGAYGGGFSGVENAELFARQTAAASLIVAPFSVVLTVYGMFALLNVVRCNEGAWQAWLSAFRLVPREAWWRTIGLLAALDFLVVLLSVLVAPTGKLTAAAWLGMGVGSAVAWYTSLCLVSVWHQFAFPAPDREPAGVSGR